MPGLKIRCEPLPPKSNQPGLAPSLLYSGSRFQGQQKSKGNCYDVEVVLQVYKLDVDSQIDPEADVKGLDFLIMFWCLCFIFNTTDRSFVFSQNHL